jgi:putative sterol carrier protein
MAHPFLSPDWMRDYQTAWNGRADIVEGLKGFHAWIEYGWADGGKPSVYLRVADGRAEDVREDVPKKTDFVMHATAENWQKIYSGELNGRAALLTRKLQFKDSMITAMRCMGPFNASIALIAQVPHAGQWISE